MIGSIRFSAVLNRLDIARIQMFQSSQFDTVHLVNEILDFTNRRDILAYILVEEFEAHRARKFRDFMEHKGGRGDETITALFLDARQAGKEFIRDILTQTDFSKICSGYRQYFG